MRWEPFYEDMLAPYRERGRPWPRLVRGLLWALLAIIVLSILAFCLGSFVPEFKDFNLLVVD